MKPTLELEEIIVALGIDLDRYRLWEQKELRGPKEVKPKENERNKAELVELFVYN
ncbi:hypothetical protein [Paenibacillus sp. SI8]|uniref:hypothetical protein n=1 Tax=unclassified Paenibacillus TaxID=185978 RepID=UPI0034671EE3